MNLNKKIVHLRVLQAISLLLLVYAVILSISQLSSYIRGEYEKLVVTDIDRYERRRVRINQAASYQTIVFILAERINPKDSTSKDGDQYEVPWGAFSGDANKLIGKEFWAELGTDGKATLLVSVSGGTSIVVLVVLIFLVSIRVVQARYFTEFHVNIIDMIKSDVFSSAIAILYFSLDFYIDYTDGLAGLYKLMAIPILTLTYTPLILYSVIRTPSWADSTPKGERGPGVVFRKNTPADD